MSNYRWEQSTVRATAQWNAEMGEKSKDRVYVETKRAIAVEKGAFEQVSETPK